MREEFRSGINYALTRRKEFVRAFRGVPVKEVIHLLTLVTHGVDWRGCSKGLLADSFARGDHRLDRFTAEELWGHR